MYQTVSIDALDLGTRAVNCLRRCGINTLGDIEKADLSRIRNCGTTTIRNITTALNKYIEAYAEEEAMPEAENNNPVRWKERKWFLIYENGIPTCAINYVEHYSVALKKSSRELDYDSYRGGMVEVREPWNRKDKAILVVNNEVSPYIAGHKI